MSNIKKNIIKINGETLVSNDFIRNPNLTGNEKMMYLILASQCPVGSKKCNPSIKRELTSDSGMSCLLYTSILFLLDINNISLVLQQNVLLFPTLPHL